MLLSLSDNEDSSVEPKPRKYCVIIFYSIINTNNKHYKYIGNSIIISERTDLLKIYSMNQNLDMITVLHKVLV